MAQRAAKLLAVDGVLWGEKPPRRLWEQLKAACMRHASFQIMRTLEVWALHLDFLGLYSEGLGLESASFQIMRTLEARPPLHHALQCGATA